MYPCIHLGEGGGAGEGCGGVCGGVEVEGGCSSAVAASTSLPQRQSVFIESAERRACTQWLRRVIH